MKEDDEKLSYLIQYCKGAAKDAIENCLMLPPEEGYKEAKEILRKNFGQKHIIVRAFIDKVVKGPQIRTWESEKLSQLARDMKSCALNSDHMHYKADINSVDTLKKIVMRLPPHLQAKWAEESKKLIEAEKEPEFSHLADFVERRATAANTAFGKLVGARPEGDIKPKFRRRPSVDPPGFCDVSQNPVREWCTSPRWCVTRPTCPQACFPRFQQTSYISLLPVLQRHTQFGKML